MSCSRTLRHAQDGIKPATLRLPDDSSYLLSYITHCKLNCEYLSIIIAVGVDVSSYIGAPVGEAMLLRQSDDSLRATPVSESLWVIVSSYGRS